METAANAIVLVFVVTCMAGAGLGLSPRDLTSLFRNPRLAALALIANFVLAPAVAVALVKSLPIGESQSIGLLVLGCAAGAPFLPKLVQAAKGDEAFGIGLMLLLMLGSVAFLPLVLPRLVPGRARSRGRFSNRSSRRCCCRWPRAWPCGVVCRFGRC